MKPAVQSCPTQQLMQPCDGLSSRMCELLLKPSRELCWIGEAAKEASAKAIIIM